MEHTDLNFANLSLDTFCQRTASDAPAPGGGSVAGLVGALSAALGRMCIALSVNKRKFAQYQQELNDSEMALAAAQTRALESMRRDAESFLPLASLYSLPAENDEQKAEKDRRMQAALETAASVPLESLENLREIAQTLAALDERTSRLLRSDRLCALLLCEAAMNMARLNVRVNTKFMPDPGIANALDQKADAILNSCAEIFRQTHTECEAF